VFSITIAWHTGTAGNVLYLRDGNDGTDPIRVAFVLDAAAGTYYREWSQGKFFEHGIYYDEGTAANVLVELTYR
jgi:hypothetical protein